MPNIWNGKAKLNEIIPTILIHKPHLSSYIAFCITTSTPNIWMILLYVIIFTGINYEEQTRKIII